MDAIGTIAIGVPCNIRLSRTCASCDAIVGPNEDYCQFCILRNDCKEIVDLKREVEHLKKMVKKLYEYINKTDDDSRLELQWSDLSKINELSPNKF